MQIIYKILKKVIEHVDLGEEVNPCRRGSLVLYETKIILQKKRKNMWAKLGNESQLNNWNFPKTDFGVLLGIYFRILKLLLATERNLDLHVSIFLKRVEYGWFKCW